MSFRALIKRWSHPPPFLFGLGAYLVLFFGTFPIAHLIVSRLPNESEALGPLTDSLIVFVPVSFLVFLVAPLLSGFLTAKAAKARPYLQLAYVFVGIQLALGLADDIPFTVSQRQILPFGMYVILTVVGLVCGISGAWYGWRSGSHKQDEELIKTLRNLKP